MCWASVSARNGDSLRTTSPIASLTTSSKRDMCAPFCAELRSTKQANRAKNSSSRMRTTFSTPVTPTRERPIGTEGARAWTSSPAAGVGDSEWICRVTCTSTKPSDRPGPSLAAGRRPGRIGPSTRRQPACTAADSGITSHLARRVNPESVRGRRLQKRRGSAAQQRRCDRYIRSRHSRARAQRENGKCDRSITEGARRSSGQGRSEQEVLRRGAVWILGVQN